MTLDPVRYLIKGAARLGLDLNRAEAEAFLRLKDELLAWNERFNLTALTAGDAVLEKHFLDSLAVWPHGGFADGMRVLDLGTGPGLPGLALALHARGRVTDVSWTLVDAVRKKVGFVRHVADVLGLDEVLAVQGRAEDLGRQPGYREGFDRVVARAVARLVVLAEYALPFVRVGGLFLAMKGPGAGEELAEAAKAIGLLGGELLRVEEYTLPYSGDRRSLVLLEKARPTPATYPRRAGLPARSPLI